MDDNYCNYKRYQSAGIYVRQFTNDIFKELFRKSIHICAAFVPVMLKYFYSVTIVLLLAAIIVYTVCEILRFYGINVPVISAITQAAERTRDRNKFVLGPVTLAMGILLAACIFNEQSAAVGIYALALGDGLASLVGKVFGRQHLYKMQGKTAEGSLACFAAIFISSFLVTGNAFQAMVIALVGMLIELMPLKDYDNLLIPVLLAFVHQFCLT